MSIETAAHLLRRRGLRPGDAVIVFLPDGRDLVEAIKAVNEAGGDVIQLVPGADSREQVLTSRARMMISDWPEAADDSQIRQVVSSAELRDS